uniref:Angiomotin_C domain-containing protein n=1 Tax=Panagrellus redivivus TaxID=6233 RepID=A0A7E4V2M5_PANRE
MDNVDSHGGGPGSSSGQIQGKILPQLVLESFGETAAQGLDIHHEKEDSTNERQVQNMIENYKTHLLQKQQQQQKAAAIAANQHFRQALPNGSANAPGPPPQPPPPPPTSHSHPCLFTMDAKQTSGQSDEFRQSPSHAIVTSDQVLGYFDQTGYTNGVPTPQTTQTMFFQDQPANTVIVKFSDLNSLRNENELLRSKVDALEQKLGGLRQLEQAYDLIEKEFEHVVQQREQQELLEKKTMAKMDQQIQRLIAENIALLQRLDTVTNESVTPQMQQQAAAAGDMRTKELTALLNEYVNQNKNLQTQKDRHLVEIEAQNETLKEQRRHIDVLENALQNAQDRIAVKDRQIMESNVLIERCNKLQQMLQSLTEERERRHEEYIKEKAQLEMDLALAKMQKENPKNTRTSPEPEDSTKLRRLLAAKDEKIAKLESDLLQIHRKYADEAGKSEYSIKAEFEALNTQYRKLELEKLERERRVHEVVNENRRLHDHLAEERAAMDRRFGVLEEHIQRLANQRPLPSPQHRNHAVSVNSLHTINNPSMDFDYQRPASVDPAYRMEEMRRNIAARKQQPPPSLFSRSYSRARMPSSSTANLTMSHPPRSPPPTQDHFRASSGPSSAVHSTMNPISDKDQPLLERQLADYVASLPESTRRRFITATGLNDNFGFASSSTPVSPPAPQSTSSTPDLPEGAKLTLMRQTSKSTPTPEAPSNTGVRIHLTDSDRPKLGHCESTLSDVDPSELRSRSGSDSDSEHIPNPRPGSDVYAYEVQPPQSHTTTTTTVVEVNRDNLSSSHNAVAAGNHRVRSKVGPQRSLTRQASSAGSESVGGASGYVTGSSESPR